MPKLLVLFEPGDASAAALAEDIASGARGIRFMEVDVRTVGAPAERVRKIDAGAAREYDGMVFVANAPDVSNSIAAFLSELSAGGETMNTVFAAAGQAAGAVLARCATLGGILVTLREPGDPSAVGARTAKVVGWVRHALGHEAEHHHHHSHSHHH